MHLKKHLSFTAIRQMIAENFTSIKDSRAANSDSKYSVEARQHLGPKKWFFVEKNQKKNHEL